MTVILRIILIIVSLLTFCYISRKIRNAKMVIEESIFWIFFAAFLLMISIFPQIADFGADLLGIYSSTNFIFLLMIFILILKIFSLSLKVSQLYDKLRKYMQDTAIKDKNNLDNLKNEYIVTNEDENEKI